MIVGGPHKNNAKVGSKTTAQISQRVAAEKARALKAWAQQHEEAAAMTAVTEPVVSARSDLRKGGTRGKGKGHFVRENQPFHSTIHHSNDFHLSIKKAEEDNNQADTNKHSEAPLPKDGTFITSLGGVKTSPLSSPRRLDGQLASFAEDGEQELWYNEERTSLLDLARERAQILQDAVAQEGTTKEKSGDKPKDKPKIATQPGLRKLPGTAKNKLDVFRQAASSIAFSAMAVSPSKRRKSTTGGGGGTGANPMWVPETEMAMVDSETYKMLQRLPQVTKEALLEAGGIEDDLEY